MTLWNRQRALWKNPNVAYLPLATLAVRGGRASCPMPVIGIRRRLSPAGRGSKRRANDHVRLVSARFYPCSTRSEVSPDLSRDQQRRYVFQTDDPVNFTARVGARDRHARDPNRREIRHANSHRSRERRRSPVVIIGIHATAESKYRADPRFLWDMGPPYFSRCRAPVERCGAGEEPFARDHRDCWDAGSL